VLREGITGRTRRYARHKYNKDLDLAKDKLTPLMEQYYRIKQDYPGKILFFRMGDFYEMFGEDAEEAAPILEIALTSRAHGSTVDRIPLAGIPYHALEKYLGPLNPVFHSSPSTVDYLLHFLNPRHNHTNEADIYRAVSRR